MVRTGAKGLCPISYFAPARLPTALKSKVDEAIADLARNPSRLILREQLGR